MRSLTFLYFIPFKVYVRDTLQCSGLTLVSPPFGEGDTQIGALPLHHSNSAVQYGTEEGLCCAVWYRGRTVQCSMVQRKDSAVQHSVTGQDPHLGWWEYSQPQLVIFMIWIYGYSKGPS